MERFEPTASPHHSRTPIGQPSPSNLSATPQPYQPLTPADPQLPLPAPTRNSMRALLATRRRNGGLHVLQPNAAPPLHHLYGTHENIYEEITDAVSERCRVLGAGHSMISLTPQTVEEEFRRVHTRHRRVLDELNLEVEAMLMPETPAASDDDDDQTQDSARPSAAGRSSDDNIVAHLSGVVGGLDLKLASSSSHRPCNAAAAGASDELLSPGSGHHVMAALTGGGGGVGGVVSGGGGGGDMDSGFSGSSSGGASYMGSLRYRTSASGGTAERCTTPSIGGSLAAGATTALADGACGGSATTTTPSSMGNAEAVMMLMMMNGSSTTPTLRSVSACGEARARTPPGASTPSLLLFGRAMEDPGPSTRMATPTKGEKKSSGFWSRKGWRKLSSSFSSSGSVHKAGLLSGELELRGSVCRRLEVQSSICLYY